MDGHMPITERTVIRVFNQNAVPGQNWRPTWTLYSLHELLEWSERRDRPSGVHYTYILFAQIGRPASPCGYHDLRDGTVRVQNDGANMIISASSVPDLIWGYNWLLGVPLGPAQ